MWEVSDKRRFTKIEDEKVAGWFCINDVSIIQIVKDEDYYNIFMKIADKDIIFNLGCKTKEAAEGKVKQIMGWE